MKRIRSIFVMVMVFLVAISTINSPVYGQRDGQRDNGRKQQEKQDRMQQERAQNKTKKRQERERGHDEARQRDQQRVQEKARNKEERRDRNRDNAGGQRDQNRGGDRAGQDRQQRDRNNDRDRDRNYRDRRPSPPVRVAPEHHRERWVREHRHYRRPSSGFYFPRHGRDYSHRHYEHGYRRPLVIVIAHIPIIIYRHPTYRNCRLVSRWIGNFSDYRAQVLINGVPYWFPTLGRDFLYPGESYWVRVPSDRLHDLDAAVYIYGDWYEVELKSGNGSDLVISDPF